MQYTPSKIFARTKCALIILYSIKIYTMSSGDRVCTAIYQFGFACLGDKHLAPQYHNLQQQSKAGVPSGKLQYP